MSDGLKENERRTIELVLQQYPAVTQATLYGSRALGTYRHSSDIDLALTGNIDLKTLNDISLKLDDLLLPYDIDLSILNLIDNQALVDHIHRAGKIFYRADK